jgi:hypothetical protein
MHSLTSKPQGIWRMDIYETKEIYKNLKTNYPNQVAIAKIPHRR